MSRVPSYMGLGARHGLPKKLSTASTATTVASEDAGRLLLVGGQSSAQRIQLPTPEFGLSFRFAFTADAVSSGTLIGPSTAFDIILDGTTYVWAQFNSTSEDGQTIEFVGLNDNRYLAIPGSRGLNAKTSNSTVSWDGVTT